MLRWHFKLGHASSSIIKWMAKIGLLDNASKAIDELQDYLKCETCQYAKQARRSTETKVTLVKAWKRRSSSRFHH